MWRHLFHQYKGGDETVATGGINFFLKFGRWEKLANLDAHLNRRESTLSGYGRELFKYPNMLRAVALRLIPSEFENLRSPHVRRSTGKYRDVLNYAKPTATYERNITLAEHARKSVGNRLLRFRGVDLQEDDWRQS